MIKTFALGKLQKKIAFSTLVQYGGKFVQMACAIVAMKLISNFLGANDYGIYAKITEYALFFSVAANLGIFANLVRKMADHPEDGRVFFNALLLRLLSAAIFFVLGYFILFFNTDDPIFLIGSALFFGALFFDYVTSVCDAALQAQYHMGRATFALVVGRLVNVGLLWLLLKKFSVESEGLEIVYALMPALFSSIFTALISFFFIRRLIFGKFYFDTMFMWEIFKTSLPFGIINIVNNLYFRFLPDYLVSSSGLTSAQFATYNVSFKIAQVLSLFSTFLMFSVLPGLKEYIDAKKWDNARALLKKIKWLLTICALGLIIFGSLLGPFMLELLTSKDYFLPQFWFVLPMMLLLAGISYFYDLILIVLFALEEDFWILKREFLALSVAGAFFVFSFLISDPLQKLPVILLGAICGECVMVVLGLRKMKRL